MNFNEAQLLERFFDWKDWYTKAHYLKNSADLLHDKIIDDTKNRGRDIFSWQTSMLSTIGPALTLTGLSIENLLKAQIIHNFLQRHKFPKREEFELDEEFFQAIEAYKKIFKSFKESAKWNSQGGHGIYDIFKESSINLEVSEYNFVKRVQIYLVWGGKYFFPNLKRLSNYEYESSMLKYSKNDKTLFSNIINKIKAELPDHKIDFT